MKRFYLIGFFVLMCCDTLAQCGIKAASLRVGAFSLHGVWLLPMLHQQWLWAAIAGYVGAFFCWMTLLKTAPVGPAFAASHIEKVSVIFISVVWLGERLTLMQGIGCFLILAGIALLGCQDVFQKQFANAFHAN